MVAFAKAAALGSAARERAAEQFSRHAMVSATEAVYARQRS